MTRIAGVLHMADVGPQVALPLAAEFENYSVFKPSDNSWKVLGDMLGDVVSWSAALAPLRAVATASAA